MQLALTPEQAPDQPAKLLPAAGVAVSVTLVPLGKLALHVVPQLMPEGLERTVPVPLPDLLTLSVKKVLEPPPPPPPPLPLPLPLPPPPVLALTEPPPHPDTSKTADNINNIDIGGNRLGENRGMIECVHRRTCAYARCHMLSATAVGRTVNGMCRQTKSEPMNARFSGASGPQSLGGLARAGILVLLGAAAACTTAVERGLAALRVLQTELASHRAQLQWSAPRESIAGLLLVYRDDVPPAPIRSMVSGDERHDSGRRYRDAGHAYDAEGGLSTPSRALELAAPPADSRCHEVGFSFLVFSDTYEGEEAGLERALAWARTRLPQLRFVVSAGDTPPWLRIRTLLDRQFLPGEAALCGALAMPWFPTAGNHDLESVSAMQQWAARWADDPATVWDEWPFSASDSPLARQLPGLERFVRGPLTVWGVGPDGHDILWRLPAATVYGFDYRGARFVFLNVYERGFLDDPDAGIEDGNGERFDARHSQLDWLDALLEQAPKPRAVFVFGHVALRAPCYNYSPPDPRWACPGPPPPNWSEHNSRFRTAALLERLVSHGVTAYFHGHDHVPSRLLLAADGTVLEDRRFWQVARRFPPSRRSPLASPIPSGALWQVDAGRIALAQGSFVHVRVRARRVDFEIYRYSAPDYAYPGDPIPRGELVLWDHWSVRLDQSAEALWVPAAWR